MGNVGCIKYYIWSILSHSGAYKTKREGGGGGNGILYFISGAITGPNPLEIVTQSTEFCQCRSVTIIQPVLETQNVLMKTIPSAYFLLQLSILISFDSLLVKSAFCCG